jgi:WD40 repeat protein
MRSATTLPPFVPSDGQPELVTDFVVSNDRVFCGTGAGVLRVTDVRTPRSEIVYDGHNGRVTTMCVANDERVFTGGVDHTCRSYDVRQVTNTRSRSESTLVRTNRCRAVYAGHTGEILEVRANFRRPFDVCSSVTPLGRFVALLRSNNRSHSTKTYCIRRRPTSRCEFGATSTGKRAV